MRTVRVTDLRDLIMEVATIGDLVGVRHLAQGIARLATTIDPASR